MGDGEGIMNTPIPICKSFLTCRDIAADPNYNDVVLVGLRSFHEHHRYPASVRVGIFARLASAHGQYRIEIQLQSPEGEVVWTDGPPEPWTLDDPLYNYDLRFIINLVFPAPGTYDLVLLANGQEVARDRYSARLLQHAGSQ
jgi:hypothetical protein